MINGTAHCGSGSAWQQREAGEADCGRVRQLRDTDTSQHHVLGEELGIWISTWNILILSGPGSHDAGVTGTMTVVTTVMRGAVCTLPATRPFLHVRTDSALIRSMSVMGTMTVEITRMSSSTCVTPRKPHVPLISSGVTMGTALRWWKSVTTSLTVQTAVMRKDVVSITED